MAVAMESAQTQLVNYLEVVIFFPNMRMSKNHARGHAAGLDPTRTFWCPLSEKFKTHKRGGGPDRTRTYDPALIKRML